MFKLSVLLIVCCLIFESTAHGTSAYFKLKSFNELKMENIKRQTLDYSCGAASMSILLQNYFQDDRDEHELLSDILYRLSNEEKKDRIRNGFSMFDLKLLAKRLGYSASGILLSEKAISFLPCPVIVLLRKKGLHHFVVLKGTSQGLVFITDPARGHLRMPLYEFFEQWNGETLILEKSEFGFPEIHDLSIPTGDAIAPERDVVRVLQHIPPP